MTTPTPPTLAEIEALLHAATPGPWMKIPQLDNYGLETDLFQVDCDGPAMVCQELSAEADAALIAAAPEAIAYLLRLVRERDARLAGIAEELTYALDHLQEPPPVGGIGTNRTYSWMMLPTHREEARNTLQRIHALATKETP